MLIEREMQERDKERDFSRTLERAGVVRKVVAEIREGHLDEVKKIKEFSIGDKRWVTDCVNFWMCVGNANKRMEERGDKYFQPENGVRKLGYFLGYRQILVSDRKLYPSYGLENIAGYFNRFKGIVVNNPNAIPHEQNHAVYERFSEMKEKTKRGYRERIIQENQLIREAFAKCTEFVQKDPDKMKTSREWQFLVGVLVDHAKDEVLAELGVGNFKWHRKNLLKGGEGSYFNRYVDWMNMAIGDGGTVEKAGIKSLLFQDYVHVLRNKVQKSFNLTENFGADMVWQAKKETLWWALADIPVEEWDAFIDHTDWSGEVARYNEAKYLREIFRPSEMKPSQSDQAVWQALEVEWAAIGELVKLKPEENHIQEVNRLIAQMEVQLK